MATATKSPVLAGPPGDCCFTTVKHSGEPVGKKITIAGVETYISEPPANTTGPSKVILFLSDVFGPFYLNNQLVQDYFAAQGFTVLGIDYFFGDPIYLHMGKEGWDRTPWMNKARENAKEFVPKWVQGIKETYGAAAKYSAIGYCFGGPYALELAMSDDVVAASFAHPSSLEEDHFKKCKKPLLMLCAEEDRSFPAASRRRAEDILVENKATYHIQVFSGVSHGFATRGDPEVENIRWAKEEAARSAVEWFKRFSK